MDTMSKKTQQQCVIHNFRHSISELGRSGLTFNWGEMKSNQEYFISRDDIISMNTLWFLNKKKIQERAKELNAEIIMFENVIKDGWVIRLRQYCD